MPTAFRREVDHAIARIGEIARRNGAEVREATG